MPRNNVRADSRFQKAVEYLLKNPNLTVRDGMKLANFSQGEQNDKAKYMMVMCLWNKSKKDDFVTPPTQLISTASRQNTEETISTVTMSEESDVTSPAEVEKKVKLTRATATAVQLHCIARLKKMKEYNTAFKRATIMYEREKEKRETGMSARDVVDLIRNNCKVQLCPRTIKRKSRKEVLEVRH
jgi:hypothetical protein